MPTAESTLETIARSIQASEHVSYAQAYAQALEQNPHLYAEMEADPTGRYQALHQGQQDQARQFDEAYSPGRGFERQAEDRIDKEARRIQASEGLDYHTAYAKALQKNPELYEAHSRGSVVRQLSELGVTAPENEPRQFGSNADMWGSTTPSGVARSKAETDLLNDLNTALRPLQARYPRAPRDFILSVLFATNKTLQRRCEAACHMSGS